MLGMVFAAILSFVAVACFVWIQLCFGFLLLDIYLGEAMRLLLLLLQQLDLVGSVL